MISDVTKAKTLEEGADSKEKEEFWRLSRMLEMCESS
jgi:hypothetical protein